jgi:RimJ/RimL family protein N-acetyltransferase
VLEVVDVELDVVVVLDPVVVGPSPTVVVGLPAVVVTSAGTVDDGAEIGSVPSSAHAAATIANTATTAAPRHLDPLIVNAPGASGDGRRYHDSTTIRCMRPGPSGPSPTCRAAARSRLEHDGGVTLDDLTWPVRSERLLLRRATADDAEAIWSIRSQPGVSDWLTRAAVDHDAFVAHTSEPSWLATSLVVERLAEPGAVIGDLMISIKDPWAQYEVAEQARGVEAELGWVFSPEHGGRGYATEAVRAAMAICFDQLGLRRVTASCFADNEASWRLMERVGMRREVHTVRESLHRSGEWLDGLGYALLADEWHA